MLSFFTDFSERGYWIALTMGGVLFIAAIEVMLRDRVVDIRNITPNLIHQVYAANDKTIALGDSHIYRAFIHGDGVLNLGRGGLSAHAMRLVGEAYFQRRTPGRAIIGVGPQLLSRPVDHSRFDQFLGQYRWFGSGLYAFEPGINSHTSWLFNDSRYSRAVDQHEKNLRIGGHWRSISEQDRRARIFKGMSHQRPDWQGTAQASIDEIEGLLQTLSQKGVESCLLLTPLAQGYRQLIAADADFSRAIDAFKRLADDVGVRFVDSHALSPALTDADFINQDHLAATRSAQFSQAALNACFNDSSS